MRKTPISLTISGWTEARCGKGVAKAAEATIRQALLLTVCFAALAPVFSASAALRWLGEIDKAGSADGSPDHIVLTSKYTGEWEAVESSNGGQTWCAVKKEAVPAPLLPLSDSGDIRYRLVGRNRLIRSSDAGVTWRDISPWTFLKDRIREENKREKARFMSEYGARVPDDEHWFVAFCGMAVALLVLSACLLGRKRQRWFLPASVSTVHFLLAGAVLYGFHLIYANGMLYGQWNTRLAHSGPILVPLRAMGIALHLSGNIRVAPVTAILCFPVTLLYWELAERAAAWRGTFRALGVLSIGLVAAVMVIGVLWGRGFTWCIE